MGRPLTNRQRVILDLLVRAPRRPSKIQLVKWLFLLQHEHELGESIPFFDFLPHHYGPFSFTAYRELNDLSERGLIGTDLKVVDPEEGERLANALPGAVRTPVEKVLAEYGRMSSGDLLDRVYDEYPWFASRSRLRPRQAQPDVPCAVYTIGYEGESIDRFVERLLRSGMERVVDVRRNAYSRKYGFTGGPMRGILAKVGIDYAHIPGLGVPSALRKDLSTEKKRAQLFRHYESEMLPLQEPDLERAAALLDEAPSALMCFEESATDCHRGPLSRAVSRLTGMEVIDL